MRQPETLAAQLLAWYRQNRRHLPFREDPTPYHVWVSEIMLQQTRVEAVLPYYNRFIAALPDIAALAACDEEQLHKLWQGLGYYNRARNLQAAARLVVRDHGGQLPAHYEALLQLPGIGAYTAGAIASIAFGLPEVAVDGNVLRVFSRLCAHAGDVLKPDTKQALSLEVRRHMPKTAPGDYNQALMELGALLCLPGRPQCGACPIAAHCEGHRRGIAEALPHKAPKKPPVAGSVCVLVVRSARGVLLHKRPATGLLANLWEPVTFEGRFTKTEAQEQLAQLLPGATMQGQLPKAKHVFTHRVWHLYGWLATAPPDASLADHDYRWASPAEVNSVYAIPGAFKTYIPYME